MSTIDGYWPNYKTIIDTSSSRSFCDSVNATTSAIQRWSSMDSASCRYLALVVAIQRWLSLFSASCRYLSLFIAGYATLSHAMASASLR